MSHTRATNSLDKTFLDDTFLHVEGQLAATLTDAGKQQQHRVPPVSSQEALKFNLVNYVGTMEELNKRLDFYTESYLSASPAAIRDCKQLIRSVAGHDNPYSEVFDMTSALIANERMGKDAQERMKKFIEK